MSTAVSIAGGEPRVRSLARPVGILAAGAGIAAVVGAVAWLVVAAAERPSPLSPPTARRPEAWVLGPLHGLMGSLSSDPVRLHRDLAVALAVAGGGWLVAWLAAGALPARVVLGAVAVAHGLLLLAPPLPLTDVFNYELYGRMASLHGLNPYRALPVAARHDPVYHLANWHHLSSPYGPLFTLGSQALVNLGVHGWLWGWKVVVALTSLGTVALAGALARRAGASPARAIALVGLSPLLLVFEVGGLHNDMPAVLCLVAAAWCVVESRGGGRAWAAPAAGALAVAAAGIKPSLAIVVPLVVLGAGSRTRAVAGAAVAAVAVGLVTLVAYDGALPDLSTQGELVTPLSVPNLLGLAAGHGGADPAVRSVARVAIVAIALAAAGAVAVRRERSVAATAVVLVAAVLALGWVMPWYLVWALPFVAVARSRLWVPAVALLTAWLIVGGLPQLPAILHWAGYYPTRLDTGLANHLLFHRLVR